MDMAKTGRCSKGKPCGNTCIKKSYECGKRPLYNRVGIQPVASNLPPRVVPYIPSPDAHIVDLSINLISGYVVETGGCSARSTITCGDIEQYVVPILNYIYRETGVGFVLSHCAVTPAEEQVENPYDVDDVRKIEELFELQPFYDSSSMNIFVVPLCAGDVLAYQLESDDGTFIVMGENDPETCKPLTKMQFTETLAHEIGHDLGLLKHNPDVTNLMYWSDDSGVVLTPRQGRKVLETALDKYPLRRIRAKRKALVRVARKNPRIRVDRKSGER